MPALGCERMPKVKHMVILAFLLGMLPSCGKTPVEPDPDPDWVALTARFDDYQQIYLVDYNDPSIYKRITKDDHYYGETTFFPDRSRLLYFDRSTGLVGNPQFVLYELTEDTSIYLFVQPPEEGFPPDKLSGNKPVVITPDQKRVYYRISCLGSRAAYSDFKYSLTTNYLITPPYKAFGFVIGCIGADTLIVYSSDSYSSRPRGYYLMDTAGRYLCYLDHPYLTGAIVGIEWNRARRLFVFSKQGSGYPGRIIAVTNLDGSFYKTYTSGYYRDDHPTWGPGGEVILFDRTHSGPPFLEPEKVMVLNLKTGQDWEFVEPSAIDGATDLMFPNY